MSKTGMSTLCMPVSGGHIVNQMALVLHLIGCGYRPKRILATSGGAIVATVITTADYTTVKCSHSFACFKKRVYEILDELDMTWYMRPWCNVTLFNSAYGIRKGSTFDRGHGEQTMRLYDVDFSSAPEICFGVQCATDGVQVIMSTKSEKEKSVKCAMPLNANKEVIIKAAMASCSIPTVVPDVEIKGKMYRDGGCTYASPLTLCYDSKEEYKVIYISPCSYSNSTHKNAHIEENDNVWNQTHKKTVGMLSTSRVADRNIGVEMVGFDAKCNVRRSHDHTCKELDRHINKATRSFIELIPNTTHHVNFLACARGEFSAAVKKSFNDGFVLKHWYV